jgi:hypothetical protein
MITIELPVIEQKIEEGKLIETKTKLKAYIDTSIYSQTRWEINFPKEAEKEGLFDYIERIKEYKQVDIAKTISLLKAIYCFMEIDKSFKDFLKLFNVSDNTLPLINALKDTFEIILNSSAEKN